MSEAHGINVRPNSTLATYPYEGDLKVRAGPHAGPRRVDEDATMANIIIALLYLVAALLEFLMAFKKFW